MKSPRRYAKDAATRNFSAQVHAQAELARLAFLGCGAAGSDLRAALESLRIAHEQLVFDEACRLIGMRLGRGAKRRLQEATR
jgi:hypothetical protein